MFVQLLGSHLWNKTKIFNNGLVLFRTTMRIKTCVKVRVVSVIKFPASRADQEKLFQMYFSLLISIIDKQFEPWLRCIRKTKVKIFCQQENSYLMRDILWFVSFLYIHMKPFYKDVKSRKGLDSENMVRKDPRLIFSEQFGFFFPSCLKVTSTLI